MRARYSAYVMRDPAFLYRSWSRATRPPKRELATGQPTEWLGLEILRIEQGGEQDDCGLVEFVARYRNGAGEESLHETSRFRRENGRWVYVDGECRQEGEA